MEGWNLRSFLPSNIIDSGLRCAASFCRHKTVVYAEEAPSLDHRGKVPLPQKANWNRAGNKATSTEMDYTIDRGLIPGNSDRFKRQVEFLLEIDRLKLTLRQTILLDRSRQENSVEHSWHIAMSAVIFAEYAATHAVDMERVIRMLLVHDLVEIDAGDTYCYDEQGVIDQHARENQAAERIFGLLPSDQAQDFRRLWGEFEEARTFEARYALAMDRFQAFLHNYFTQGQVWRQHGIRREQVIRRMQPVEGGAPLLWEFVRALIDDAVFKGYLLP